MAIDIDADPEEIVLDDVEMVAREEDGAQDGGNGGAAGDGGAGPGLE